ncbi:MAG: ribosomal L7Ae/L30e/S12e/Gadd45 family protein [Clostridia bacterium]|nr:ribosomal L7Ae/L30e/S12e/Gadd45 family protein [Clostridia bacterium]
MTGDKILTLLGFCRKAGKLTAGTEKVTELVKKGVSCLVMLSSDISAKTEKELKYHASGGKAVFIRLNFDRKTVAHATKTTAGVLATADEGFQKAILQGGNVNE